MPNQTIPLQWTEQLLNTFAQGAFAFAAWKLAQAQMADGRPIPADGQPTAVSRQ
jgi:hypothetical protein